MGRVAGGGGKYWEVRRGRGGGGREREGKGGVEGETSLEVLFSSF